MKITLLGGTGFLGSWIARELVARQLRVRIVTRSISALEIAQGNGVDYLRGDFTNRALLEQAFHDCEVVVHAGGYYPIFSIHRDTQLAEALHEVRMILDACEATGVQKFIFTSSPMVLVNDRKAFRHCAYHEIKLAMHDEVLRRMRKGLPGTVMVPGACFGPGDIKPTTGRLILEIASKRLRFVLDGRMNAVDVRDIARAYAEAVIRSITRSVYQLGGWNCSLSEFAATVSLIAGVTASRVSLPYMPTRAFALSAEWLQYHAGASRPLLPCAGLDQIHYGTHLDSSAAVSDLNFTTRPIATTIAETIEYFKSVGYLRRKRISKASLHWSLKRRILSPEGG
jgi:dihydroflavonol-4-reductase